MDWNAELQRLAQDRKVDMARAVDTSKHPHGVDELQGMLKGTAPQTQEGMLAILAVVAPVSGAHALSDSTLRVQALPAIMRLPHCKKWHRPADLGGGSQQQREKREAALRWMEQPVTEKDTFSNGLRHAMAYAGRSQNDFALGTGITKQAVSRYFADSIPLNYRATETLLQNWAIPKPMQDKIGALYENERRAMYSSRKNANGMHPFGHALHQVLDEMGISCDDFDRRAVTECAEPTRAQRWCSKSLDMPERVEGVLDVLKHVGASPEQQLSVMQGYYNQLEEIRVRSGSSR